MAQVTRLLPGSTVETFSSGHPGLMNRQTYPIIDGNGCQFVVLPIEEYRNLKANKTGWYVLAGLGGAGLAAVLLALFYRPNLDPVVIEKPVVVEKQVPVYKNCLLVCH